MSSTKVAPFFTAYSASLCSTSARFASVGGLAKGGGGSQGLKNWAATSDITCQAAGEIVCASVAGRASFHHAVSPPNF